jgi:hypothetical protein
MIFEQETYMIATHFMSAIINGDVTGLEENEDAELDRFLQSVGHDGVWDCDDDQAQFAQDEVTGLWADCLEVKFYREAQP